MKQTRDSQRGRSQAGGADRAVAPGKRTLVQARYAATGARSGPSEAPAGAGTALPGATRTQMEQSLGADFSGVRIHQDAAAESMGAQAFTQGSDIHFAAGQYNPSSPAGLELLGHELTHTVQQAEGRVAAPTQAKGGVVNADPGLEREADVMGAKAARGEVARPGNTRAGQGKVTQAKRASGVIQAFNRHTSTGAEGEGPNTVSSNAATETTATFKTVPELRALTIPQFMDYAETQADWSIQITDAGQKTQLRDALTFLRAERARRTGLSTFHISALVDDGLSNLEAVDAYCRGRNRSETVQVDQASTVADARDVGVDIVALEVVLGGGQLKHIFTPQEFNNLRAAGRIGMFATYVTSCAPVLHAHHGKEIQSFNLLAASNDPASFSDINDVRNYHRFQQPALEAMRDHQAGNSSNKPMTLVLHSALDHNGAFHHDPEMTKVMISPSSHAFMIEGASTLDQVSGRLPSIVALHGRDEPDPANPGQTVKRIDQLMLAGHGSAQSIELAGTLSTGADGNVQTNRDGDPLVTDDSLDLNVDPEDPDSVDRANRSRAFLTQLMNLMSADAGTAHGRVVFNACLTASNEIDTAAIDPNASVADQQAQMRDAIANSPSLVTATRQIAADQGRDNVSVLGGNGSFGEVGLIDGSGGLDIVADGTDPDGDGRPRTLDPELTNADKFAYVERGTDPDGCLSAVAECWANDRTRTLAAVQARRDAPIGGGWKEQVVQGFYTLVKTSYGSSGADIVRLTHAIYGFEKLGTTNAAVWRIWNFTKDWTSLHGSLSTHNNWTNQSFVPLVFFQAWMFHDQTKQADFLGALAAMSCREADDYINVDRLRRPWAQLVPAAASNPPAAGRLRLALLDVYAKGADAHANSKAFLSTLVTNGAFTVDVDGPLAGLTDADAVLRDLGLHPSQQIADRPDPDAGPDAAPDANVDMDKDGDNDSVVQPMSRYGVINAGSLYARAQPTTRGRPLDRLLRRGERVYIMGQSANWYLLDIDGERGYSYKRYIDLE